MKASTIFAAMTYFSAHWHRHIHGFSRTARVIYNRIDIELAKCMRKCVLWFESYKQYTERHQQFTPNLPLSKECEVECVA